jgi:hypothetical protein
VHTVHISECHSTQHKSGSRHPRPAHFSGTRCEAVWDHNDTQQDVSRPKPKTKTAATLYSAVSIHIVLGGKANRHGQHTEAMHHSSDE